MKYDYSLPDDMGYGELPEASGDGLFIINEGNFMYGNATLSYYDPTAHTVQNEVFARANGMKLGDVAQSMTIHGDLGWIVVNNSHVIFAIDLKTFREVGRITGLTSPRYMHFVSDTKAYVTQIWDSRICIVDPQRYEVTGYIDCPGMTPENASTEQMVQIGDYVYVNCWSYQNRLLKIDTRTDQIVAQLEVGIQPTSLVADRNGKLWTVTDGGYEGSPYGYEAPALYRIDPETFSVPHAPRRRPLGDRHRRHGQRDILDQQRYMAYGRHLRAASRAAPYREPRNHILRAHGRPRNLGRICRRCRRLRAERHNLPLQRRGRAGRLLLCRHHARSLLLEITPPP